MSCSQIKATLRSAAPVILPSMLMCDFTNLEREVRRLEEAGEVEAARALIPGSKQKEMRKWKLVCGLQTQPKKESGT